MAPTHRLTRRPTCGRVAVGPVKVRPMSDELSDRWHIAVCTELESRVKNRDFFLWVSAEPSGDASPPEQLDAEEWTALGQAVAEWLDGMSVEAVSSDDPPTHEAHAGGTLVALTATPKKPNRRGTDPLVLNRYPGATYFQGTYSAGPAPELPDDD